ncbi:MAG: acyl-CoA thioester hydrolase/BAAT C-terminal domain-containing protein [Oscillospiraceae bacterium]
MKKEYTLKQDGFRAVWFEGTKSRDKAIIYMSGAGCGEEVTVEMSQYLVNNGYSVLCLGFYLWKGLPKKMYSIPVEYVEKAVAELKRNGFGKIAIHGMSTGAGYALLCSSLIPEITCTIAVVPYDYVMEGVAGSIFPKNCSVYTYKGKDIPYSKFPILHISLLKELKKYFAIPRSERKGLMRYSYDTSEHAECGRIKVENMNSDILLLGMNNDDCWPSDMAVPRIKKILEEQNYPHRVKALVYEKGSHLIGCAKIPQKLKKLVPFMFPNEKRFPKECIEARKDSQKQILDFLCKW